MSPDSDHPNVWGVLKCGEIVSMHGILHADGKWWQHCPVHREAETFRKFRASVTDILKWQDAKKERLF